MKECPGCGTEFNSPYRHCSRSCGNRRIITADQREARSIKNKAFWDNLSEEDRELRRESCRQNMVVAQKTAHEKRQTLINARPFDELGWDLKRRTVLKEQEHKCAKCHLDTWCGKPLPLEVDHIDGDNNNDARDNLEALCPNCHSQTTTWRGRNKGASKKISDADLLAALTETGGNIRQALLKVGLAAKGGNYVRARLLRTSVP